MKKLMGGFFFCLLAWQAQGQTAPVDTSFQAEGNPIITHKYTADPAALVHEGRLYVYAGHDECPAPQAGYVMNEWLVFSTEDLVNWVEHPVPLRVSDFAWAKADAWAAQVIERNGKFYWYVTVEHATVPGKSIGVAVADHPWGPFKDARGSALVTNDLTTEHTRISWDDIDPTVYLDEAGQAYLYWGNTQCYYVKLAENMVDTLGPIVAVEGLPHFTEAPWIHRYQDQYYLSYATGFPEKTAYATSDQLTGPWAYRGILNEIAGNSNTNHQAIVEFNGEWFFIYHNGGINPHGSSYRRSVCIDRLFHQADGTIKRIQMTSEGVSSMAQE